MRRVLSRLGLLFAALFMSLILLEGLYRRLLYSGLFAEEMKQKVLGRSR